MTAGRYSFKRGIPFLDCTTTDIFIVYSLFLFSSFNKQTVFWVCYYYNFHIFTIKNLFFYLYNKKKARKFRAFAIQYNFGFMKVQQQSVYCNNFIARFILCIIILRVGCIMNNASQIINELSLKRTAIQKAIDDLLRLLAV